jgi:hypothetical protein
VSGPAAVVTVFDRAFGELEKLVEDISEVIKGGVDGSVFCFRGLNRKWNLVRLISLTDTYFVVA